MLTLTITLFALSFVAEAVAVTLIFSEARAAQRALHRWKAANPLGNQQGSFGQTLELNEIMSGLLGRPMLRFTAAALVAFGLVTGTAGNYTSLSL